MLTGIELGLYLTYIVFGILFTEFMCYLTEKQYPVKCNLFAKLTIFLVYPLLLSYMIFNFIWFALVYIFTGKTP